ncbi:MAG TPA: NACHT domain-containing protein [Pyrinomonadaceae bacterium]
MKKGLDISFSVASELGKKILREQRAKLLTTKEDIEASLDLHLRAVKNWSAEVSFNDLKKAKRTTDVFIELDLYVSPKRLRIDPNEQVESIPLQKIFDAPVNHFVLLGQPGAGKTTSMKYLCQLLLHEEDFQSERFSFPILIKFRELNNETFAPDSTIILDQIVRILGLDIKFPEELQGDNPQVVKQKNTLIEKLVVNFLEELKVLLILDGFDELGKDSHRERSIKEITRLAVHLEHSAIIITSRTGDFKYYLENTNQYEICSLNKEQTSTFALKWLKDEEKAADFLTKVYRTPFADAAIRPLTLAHLCAIYERIGDIPEKPKTVYKKIVNLLLEEWDQQRAVKRKSKYAHFEIDRKYEFLCHLAYVLTVVKGTTVFSTSDLISVYRKIYEEYGLKESESRHVVNEIETHNGLLIQSGYEQFEFAHKSLQEFLTAEFLVKLPSIPKDHDGLTKLPNELAIAVAISSSPSIYFAELVLSRFKQQRLSQVFVRSLLSRLFIEKPDFKTTIWLELALLSLFSNYVEPDLASTGELTQLPYDPFFREFERTIALHHTEAMVKVLNCYETDRLYQTHDQDNIQRLSLTKRLVPEDLLPMLDVFPDTLFVRSSLLSSRPKRQLRDMNYEIL